MPKRSNLTDEQVEWLRTHVDDYPYTYLAEHIGVCVDTLKRILVRQGIKYFEAGKYVVAQSVTVQKWQRPCIKCGCTKPRPKNKYLCNPCKQAMDWEDLD